MFFFYFSKKNTSKNKFCFSITKVLFFLFSLALFSLFLTSCQSLANHRSSSPQKLAQEIKDNPKKQYLVPRPLKERNNNFYPNSLASREYFKGIASLTNQKYKQAILHFEKALSLNLSLIFFSDIYFLLGYSYLQNPSSPSFNKTKEYFKKFIDYSQKNISDSFYKNTKESNDDYQQKIIYAKEFLESSNSSPKPIKPYSFSFSPKYQHYFYNHFLVYGYNYDRRLGRDLTLPYYYYDHIGHHAGIMNVFNWNPSLDTILLLQSIGIDYQVFLAIPINIFKTPKENFSLQLMPKGYIAYQNLAEYNQGVFYYNFGIGFSLGWYLQQNIFIGFKNDLYWYHPTNKYQISLDPNSTQNQTHSPASFSQWSHSFLDVKFIYFLTRTIGLQSSFYYDYFLPENDPKKRGLKFTFYWDLLSLGVSYDVLQNEFSIDFVTFYNYRTSTR